MRSGSNPDSTASCCDARDLGSARGSAKPGPRHERIECAAGDRACRTWMHMHTHTNVDGRTGQSYDVHSRCFIPSVRDRECRARTRCPGGRTAVNEGYGASLRGGTPGSGRLVGVGHGEIGTSRYMIVPRKEKV
jgi:hypothetical protein